MQNGVKSFILFAAFSSFAASVIANGVNSNGVVLLNSTNSIVVRGTITNEVADTFIKELLLIQPQYVFLDSNGGSVIAGNRMIEQMRDKNLVCIADKAFSMAFVLLQACEHRLILDTSIVMQHQQSLGIRGELLAVSSYLNMVHTMEAYLTELQAERIGMDVDQFKTLTNTEWWLFGSEIVDYGVADEITRVSCTRELVNENTTVMIADFWEDLEVTYSKCPLIVQPLSIKSV